MVETFGGKIFTFVDTIVAILCDFLFFFFCFYIRAYFEHETRNMISWIRHVLRVDVRFD